MKRETQRKGDIAVTKVVAYFTELGCDMALPITESASYDLIVDDGALHRVQVKYSAGKEIDLRHIHSNSKGYQVRKTTNTEFDWLCVYHSGNIYLAKESFNQSTVTLKEIWKVA